MGSESELRKICSKCGANKLLSDFGKRRGKKRPDCKDCAYKAKYGKERPVKENIPDDKKKCNKCLQIKPLEDFHKDNSAKSCKKGVKPRCRKCTNKKIPQIPNGYKNCSKCKSILPLSSFYPKGEIKTAYCISCYHIWYREQNPNRKPHIEQPNIEGLKTCSKCKKTFGLEKFVKHKKSKDGRSTICKACDKKKRDSITEDEKEVRRAKARARHHQKKNDPIYKLDKNLRNQVRKGIKSKNHIRPNSLSWLLGCSIPELKEHLENQFTPEMVWDNYGSYWSIDHIVPVNSFDLSSKKEQKKCWHYSNLRPLRKEENSAKGSKVLDL